MMDRDINHLLFLHLSFSVAVCHLVDLPFNSVLSLTPILLCLWHVDNGVLNHPRILLN